MYALIDISNQMLEDSAFDHAGGHSGRPALRYLHYSPRTEEAYVYWCRAYTRR
jgi:hypothetical protein